MKSPQSHDASPQEDPARRELPDPGLSGDPAPAWFAVFAIGICFAAMLYLLAFSGGFRADTFEGRPRTGDRIAEQSPPDPALAGRRLYLQNCAPCHQPNGLGVPGLFPPLASSEWVKGGSWQGDNHLVLILLDGLQGPVQAAGKTYNNSMPPWGHLKDAQIEAVLNYIRTEWGNSAPPIPAAFIQSLREETRQRKRPWTQHELQTHPAKSAPEPGASPSPPGAPQAARS